MTNFALVGGTGHSIINFRFDLLKVLKQKYDHVYAYAPSFTEKEAELLESIKVTPCTFAFDRTGINPLKDLKTVFSLRKQLKVQNIDVALFYTPKIVIYGSIAASLAKVKNIFSMITGLGYAFSVETYKAKLVRFIQKTLYKFALRKNSKVIFQNPDDLNYFKELNLISDFQGVRVHGSGVNMQHFDKTPLPEDVSFIMIARLIKEKGIFDYIEAAKQIKTQYPNIRFYLVGSLDRNAAGLTEDMLNNLAKENIIEYLGFQEDVREAITKASVFVLPSYREGTPRSGLEAMAMGRAIITTNAPGCKEVVRENENGILVPCKDPQSLTNALSKFIQEPSLVQKMGNCSYAIACELYDVQIVNKKMLNILGQ